MIAIIAIALQSAQPTSASPMDAYQQCGLRASLERMPADQIANLKGKQIVQLVKGAARLSCFGQLETMKMMAPELDWEQATKVFDATDVGLLADGRMELVRETVCTSRLRRDGKCL